MRIRNTGQALFIGLTVVVAACSNGGASDAPSTTASTTPTSTAATGASAAPSSGASASSAAHSNLDIGVVTDVGTVNDKNVNEYTYAGAQQGADATGADPPSVVVPTSDALYAPLLRALVDQQFDIIVSTGSNLIPATVVAAKSNPDIWFIGVDQAPCMNAAGVYDPTMTDCSGDIATLLPNYIAVDYAEDQAGFLAGIVAASATKSNIIGAIGGVSGCGPCVRYMQGYTLGARSVNPAIKVKTAFVSPSDDKVGFGDQAAGRKFANQFISQNVGIDVLFQVASLTGRGGLTGDGIIDAACAAGIDVVGVDVDQHESYPPSQACILTSAEKHFAVSVSDAIVAISSGTAKPGLTIFSATNDGIGVSPYYDAATKLPTDIQARLDAAIAGMKVGSVTSCPPAPECGKTPAPKIGD